MPNDTQVLQKETFKAEQTLQLVKIEDRTGKKSEDKYYMLFFNMCVHADPDNMRNNRFLDVPIYTSEDFMRDHFPGQKKKDLVGKRYLVTVDFSPQLRTYENQKFCDFRAFVADMVEDESM